MRIAKASKSWTKVAPVLHASGKIENQCIIIPVMSITIIEPPTKEVFAFWPALNLPGLKSGSRPQLRNHWKSSEFHLLIICKSLLSCNPHWRPAIPIRIGIGSNIPEKTWMVTRSSLLPTIAVMAGMYSGIAVAIQTNIKVAVDQCTNRSVISKRSMKL